HLRKGRLHHGAELLGVLVRGSAEGIATAEFEWWQIVETWPAQEEGGTALRRLEQTLYHRSRLFRAAVPGNDAKRAGGEVVDPVVLGPRVVGPAPDRRAGDGRSRREDA